MRMSDWSSDVCSSDLVVTHTHRDHSPLSRALKATTGAPIVGCTALALDDLGPRADAAFDRDYAPDRVLADGDRVEGAGWTLVAVARSEEHTSELQSLMRISYAVVCLKTNKNKTNTMNDTVKK